MPSILVGWLNPAGLHRRWGGLEADCPRHIVYVDQQAGGMAMSYPAAVGILLRLAGNTDQALQDPTHLVRGFHCMAEDPNREVLRAEYPRLERLCATWGHDYTPDELASLHAVVQPYFDLPKPVAGLEAFVELERADVSTYFGGWRFVKIVKGVQRIDDVELVPPEELWRDGDRLDEVALRQLVTWGETVGLQGPLQSVLLWENSD